MPSKRPSYWLEGAIALFFAVLAIGFFYFLPDHVAALRKEQFQWIFNLNFPVVGGLLALSAWFFFPNQSWRMPLIVLISYLMFMTGFPPDKKLNFGLDLAGGTELLVRVEKSPDELRAEQLSKRLTDIDKAIRAAKGDAQARQEVQAELKKLRDRLREVKIKMSRLAGEEFSWREKRKLREEMNRLMQRIDDLSGKNNKEYDNIRAEITELRKSKAGTNIDQVLDILRERILATSLTEIKVAKADQNTILIQIPGLDQGRVEMIKNVIERQGILEFRLVKDMTDADRKKAENGEDIPGYDLLVSRGGTGEKLYVEKKAYVTGADVASARAEVTTRGWEVSLSFNAAGRRKFAKLTTDNVKKRLAIVLDGDLMLAPTIDEPITDGRAAIHGGFDKQRAEEIATIIRAGSLPVKLVIDSENKVGAALGEDSIKAGTEAMIIGFVLLLVIMIGYYLFAGFLAVVALLLNGVLIVGCLGLFKATLTLPGIAGIVLTLGMAVDANVLIFERIREEKESGKPLKTAIKNGYERAFITIFDANITTIFTAIILYAVGTVLIKSFAVTLIIGLLASMFSAVFVTRQLMEICYEKNLIKELKMLRLFRTPKIDFLRMRTVAVIMSVVLILAGMTTFALDARFGIDFTGGQMIQIRTVKPVSIDKVRDIVAKSDINKATVQAFGEQPEGAGKNKAMQFIITYSLEDVAEKEGKKEVDPTEVKNAFKEYLRKNLPELAKDPFPKWEEISKDEIRKMKFEDLKEEDILLSDFLRIELNLLAPAEASEVKDAINVTPFDEGIAPQEKLEVLKIEPAEGESRSFTIILRTQNKQEFPDPNDAPAQIKQEIANRLDKKGITLADPFPRERLVGGSLSTELQSKAIWAIILSSIILLIYITFRFTFSFGLGAVLALIHDLCMTLGMIALFRVDITLDVLAAILTVLGYSLNDTIVVFDRIRENMRNLKKRDFTEVLNLSINQVLARTVLTSLTTAVVIIALILFAGDVLRGFSITLLIGVITGTYSSVFIATPVVAAYSYYRRSREEAIAKAQTAGE